MKMLPLEGEYYFLRLLNTLRPYCWLIFISLSSLIASLVLNKVTNGIIFPLFFLNLLYNLVQQGGSHKEDIGFVILNGLLYDLFSGLALYIFTPLFLILYMGLKSLQKHIFQKTFLKNWLNFLYFCLACAFIQFIFYTFFYDHLYFYALLYSLKNAALVVIIFPFLNLKIYP